MNTVVNRDSVVKKKKSNNFFIPFVFLLPAIVLFFTFFYLPTIAAFYYSFTDYKFLGVAEWVGIDNYVKLFHDDLFWTALTNSAKYVLLMVPALVIIPLLIAVLANQKLKGINLFRLVIFLPVITPMISVAIGWKFVYHPQGLLNAVLQMFGLNIDVNWLLDPNTALPAIAILQTWKFVGYYMIIYLAGIQAVSQDLIEAAKL